MISDCLPCLEFRLVFKDLTAEKLNNATGFRRWTSSLALSAMEEAYEVNGKSLTY